MVSFGIDIAKEDPIYKKEIIEFTFVFTKFLFYSRNKKTVFFTAEVGRFGLVEDGACETGF